MTTELIHTHSTVEWVTEAGKKFLLTMEMEIEKDIQQWMPTDSQLRFLAYWCTPHFVTPCAVFGQYALTDEEFDYLIEHDVAKFEKIVNDNIDLYKVYANQGGNFIVKQMAISSIPCKFYDKEKHEHDDD